MILLTCLAIESLDLGKDWIPIKAIRLVTLMLVEGLEEDALKLAVVKLSCLALVLEEVMQ